MSQEKSDSLLSTGDVARHYGVAIYNVARVLDRLGYTERIGGGQFRVIRAEQMPRIEAGLLGAGFLKRGGHSNG